MRYPAAANHGLPSPDPEATRTVGIDIDLRTALALSRATTRALLELSPLSHREITAALTQEIEILEAQRDPISQAAASAVKQYLPFAA